MVAYNHAQDQVEQFEVWNEKNLTKAITPKQLSRV